MTRKSDDRMEALLEKLEQNPAVAEQLPGREGAMVRDALDGMTIYEIAQNYRVSEGAVWGILGNAARAASGQAVESTESGGFGSDTDPGVTGGYGDTGFGSLGNEPPYPIPDEPTNGWRMRDGNTD